MIKETNKINSELPKTQSESSSAAPRESYALAPELLEVICCPMDKADLKYDKKKQTLTCKKCKYVYPIIDGIPDLRPPYMIDADKAKPTEHSK